MSYRLPLDVEQLRAAVRAGGVFEYEQFYGHIPRQDGLISNAVLSQFYGAPFEIGGQRYTWAEQWMMAGKARMFKDDVTLASILRAKAPEACKALGRTVRGFEEDQWQAARFDLVTAGNVAKFGQNHALRDHLLATGDRVIVKADPRDPIWGSGHGRDEPAANDPLAWRGTNLLGFALVRTRAILRGELPEPALRAPPLPA